MKALLPNNMKKYLLYILILLSFSWRNVSAEIISTDSVNIDNTGIHGSFPSYTRWEYHKSGVFTREFLAKFNVASIVNSSYTCPERPLTTPNFDSEAELNQYILTNFWYTEGWGWTQCQPGAWYHKDVPLDNVAPCTTQEVTLPDWTKENKQICPPTTKRVYFAEYKWKYENPITHEPQRTYVNGNIEDSANKMYRTCGFYNPPSPEPLNVIKTFQYTYNWDETPPSCIPALTDDLGTILSWKDYLTDAVIKSAIQAASNWGETSIFFEDGKDWDWRWTNRHLYFRRRCYDAHSGCQWDTAQKWVKEPKELTNREETITMEALPKPYIDNVNNVWWNICEVSFQKLKNIKRTCYRTTNQTSPDAGRCSYDVGLEWNASDPLYPLIDRLPPVIDIKPNSSTDDNPWAWETVQGDKWSFYAGDISLDIDIRDKTNNPTQNGVSGLKAITFVIKDANGSIVYDESDWKPNPEIWRYNGGYEADGKDDRWDLTSITRPIFKKWSYTIEAQAWDHAGNQSWLFTKNFTVVENFRKDSSIHLIDENFKNTCNSAITATGITNPNCNPKTSSGGYIFIQSKNTPILFADATSENNFSLEWYDRYMNLLSSKKIQSIQNLPSLAPLLDQTSEVSTESALTNKFYQSNGAWRNFFNPTNEYAWETNTSGVVGLSSFSYAPGKFWQNYRGNLCYWDTFAQVDCSNPSISTYTMNWNLTPLNEFLHIFTGAIVVGNTQDNRINLGVSNDIWLHYTATNITYAWELPPNTSPKQFTVWNFLESLKPDSKNTTRNKITNTWAIIAPTSKSYVETTRQLLDWSILRYNNTWSFIIEQTNFENTFTTDPIWVESAPWVTIALQGIDWIQKTTKYYISPEANKYGSGISYATGWLNRIFIEGMKQTVWKENYITPQLNAFSEKYNPADLRNSVYKNVGILTRNREPIIATPRTKAADWVINGVKYMKWDVSLDTIKPEHDEWNTLIITDGNLKINTDFNTTKKNLAIILIRSDKNDNTTWNIQITPNVRFIGATIYTDGFVESVDTGFNSFALSNTSRTALLQQQIVFYGKIFSQNTVWGAVKWQWQEGTYYTFPTLFIPNKVPATDTNLGKAVRYDMSFLRMNNKNRDPSRNNWHEEPVVILDNKEALVNPLEVFRL